MQRKRKERATGARRNRPIWGSATLRAACLGACAIAMLGGGCGRPPPDASGVQVDLKIEPSPPAVGNSEVTVTLTEAGGTPLQGADVRVEGNMNHAGMKPSFAELREVAPGRYAGTLEFTMGGDWFVLVTTNTKAGETVEHKIDVAGVRSK